MIYEEYYDDLELEYSCFLAEQEYFEKTLLLGSKIYHESTALILIQEDFIDVISNFIDKIVSAIQEAWNKFKKKVMSFYAKPILARAKKGIASYKDGDVSVEYYHKYDLAKMDSLNIADWDYNRVHNYSDKKEYYAATYPGFYKDQDKSLRDNLSDAIISTEDKHDISKEEMQGFIDFVEKGFYDRIDKLEDDIDKFNQSIKNLKRSLNLKMNYEPDNEEQKSEENNQQSTPQNNPNNQSSNPQPNSSEPQQASSESVIDMLLGFYNNSVLLEADEEDKNDKGSKVTNNAKAGDGKTNANSEKVQWFISGNTDVLTEKMKIVKKNYTDALKILKVAFPKTKEETKIEKNDNNNKEEGEGNKENNNEKPAEQKAAQKSDYKVKGAAEPKKSLGQKFKDWINK